MVEGDRRTPKLSMTTMFTILMGMVRPLTHGRT